MYSYRSASKKHFVCPFLANVFTPSYVRNRIKDEVKRPKVPSTRSEDFKYNIYCILYEDNDIPFFVRTTSFDP